MVLIIINNLNGSGSFRLSFGYSRISHWTETSSQMARNLRLPSRFSTLSLLVFHLPSEYRSVPDACCWFCSVLQWIWGDSDKISALLGLSDHPFLAFLFDVLLKDSTSEPPHKLQMLLPSAEMKMDHSLAKESQEPFRVEDDLVDRYKVDIQDGEKFQNIFLTASRLGKLVPLEMLSLKMKSECKQLKSIANDIWLDKTQPLARTKFSQTLSRKFEGIECR